MTERDDEWPIHPDNEWPVRPVPKPVSDKPNLPCIYVPPDETETPASPAKTKPSRKQQYTRSAIFTAILTAIAGFLYVTGTFEGDEAGLFGMYAFILIMGILDIFTDDPVESKEYGKKLDAAKPRRALITDDMKDVIDMSTHHDRTADDGEWPVLKHEEPKPKFDPYEPDKQSDTYDQFWPHCPLPKKSTAFQKVRRISWIIGVSLLFPLVLSVPIGFADPVESGFPEVQLFFAIVSGFFIVVAYCEQLFVGDH